MCPAQAIIDTNARGKARLEADDEGGVEAQDSGPDLSGEGPQPKRHQSEKMLGVDK